MHHFFTDPELLSDDTARITGEEAHHAARVLRIAPGEAISVADGNGRVVEAVVTSVSPEVVDGRVTSSEERRRPVPVLVLFQAVARKDPMDLVVQKAVEVGAGAIVPFMAERTLVRWDDGKRRRHHGRWTEIARSAAKQCRSPWLTDLSPIVAGAEALPLTGADVVCHHPSPLRFREALPPDAPERLGIVIGPEGSLTERELAALASKGARVASLGERILRTETAGAIAIALAGYAYDHLG